VDFDQMLETWQAQTPYDVNREALRQALDVEEARVRREMRLQRRARWFVGIFGTGMAVWAGFWIAITIANGWPAIYAIASGVSLVVFALGVVAFWKSRGRQAEPDPNFGNSLQQEARRSLALVDFQLSLARRLILSLDGTLYIVAGAGLFSWTLTSSQDIPTASSFGGGTLFALLLIALSLRTLYKSRDARRMKKAKLEFRQQRLRELLAALDARE
jgi:hypothetical protein